MEFLGGRRTAAPASFASPMEQQLNFDEDLTGHGLKGHDVRKGKKGWTYSYYDPNAIKKTTTPAVPTEIIYRTEGGKAPEYVLKKPTTTTGIAPLPTATGAITGTTPAATNRIILTQHAATTNPLVQAITTLSRGELVHNAELLKTLETARIALEEERMRDPMLNPKGKKIATDAIQLINAMEIALREKNNDELLQKMIMHSTLATRDAAKVGTGAITGVGAQMRGPLSKSYTTIRSLVMEIGRSSEFRDLLIDTLDWIRTALWSGAKKSGPALGQALKEDLRKGDFRMSNTLTSLSSAVKQPVSGLPAPTGVPKTYESHYTVQAPPMPGVSDTPVEVINRIRLITTDPNPQIEVLDGTQTVNLSSNTQDMRSQLAFRLRELIRRFNANPQFKKSGKQLMKLMRDISSSAYSVKTAPGTGSATQHLTELGMHTKELLTRITGGQSIDPLMTQFTTLNTAVRSDPQTLGLMREWREFMLLMFKHPEQLEGDSALRTINSLIDRSRSVATSPTYMQPLKSSVKESRTLLRGLTSDAVTRNLLSSSQRLLSDLVMDEGTNRPSLYALRDSIGQIRHLVMPVVMKELEYVVLPKVEGITPQYNFSVDNIVFSANDIIPEHVFLTLETDVDLATRMLTTDYAKAELKLKILNIRTMFENVRFFFQRKRFPKVHDEGILDIGLLGAGISISIDWVVESYKGMPLQFGIRRATCAIDSLNINFKEAHHSFIDRTAVKMFNQRIKKEIEIQVANKLLDVGSSLSNVLNRFFVGRFTPSTLAPVAPMLAPVAPIAPVSAPLPRGVKAHHYEGYGPMMPPAGMAPLATAPAAPLTTPMAPLTTPMASSLPITGGYPVNSVGPGHHYGRGVKVAHYEGYQPWVNVAAPSANPLNRY